jgi:TrpR-related protein YerC/YecD
MPRVQPKSLSPDERKGLLDEFWTMVALLESRDEVKNFFKDLLSETEAVMLARRIQIAKLLLQGLGYEEIRTKLKTSYVTISGVHRWLQGGFGGYEKLLPRLQKELKRREEVGRKRLESRIPYSKEWLKRKYPLHYLLVNLVDWTTLRPPKKLRHK